MTTREMIESAFADFPYPGDDNIALHDCPECEDIRTFFRGKSWRNLKFSDLYGYSAALALMSPDAFRYFLPGFMLAFDGHFDQLGSHTFPFGIIQIGGYPDDTWNVKEEGRENRKIFDLKQRRAIASWLQELYKFDPHFWENQAAFEYTIKCVLDD